MVDSLPWVDRWWHLILIGNDDPVPLRTPHGIWWIVLVAALIAVFYLTYLRRQKSA